MGDDYTPSDSAGSPYMCLADGMWRGFLSCDLSVHFLSSLVSLDRGPVQKCASWKHAFFVHAYICCEPSLLVWVFHQVIFRHTWINIPSVVVEKMKKCMQDSDSLFHNPAYDVDISIIWWSGAKKLISRFDQLV